MYCSVEQNSPVSLIETYHMIYVHFGTMQQKLTTICGRFVKLCKRYNSQSINKLVVLPSVDCLHELLVFKRAPFFMDIS